MLLEVHCFYDTDTICERSGDQLDGISDSVIYGRLPVGLEAHDGQESRIRNGNGIFYLFFRNAHSLRRNISLVEFQRIFPDSLILILPYVSENGTYCIKNRSELHLAAHAQFITDFGKFVFAGIDSSGFHTDGTSSPCSFCFASWARIASSIGMRADARALAGGTRLADVFGAAARITKEYPSVPVVLLLYFNSIFVYGIERFFFDAEAAGISGVIIPDLPLEERNEAKPSADSHGVYLISMVTPASQERVKKILAQAQGFLYCVASLGVTGERSSFSTDFADYFRTLNELSDIPKCIGFGVSSPEQKKQFESYCDGVIVGSAIVRRIEAGIAEGLSEPELAGNIGSFVRTFTEVDI